MAFLEGKKIANANSTGPLAEEERRSKSLCLIINSRATIRDNLSRVSLKQATGTKTIEENPSYHSAGMRLVSLLEQTALPRNISPSGLNHQEIGILDAVNGYIEKWEALQSLGDEHDAKRGR